MKRILNHLIWALLFIVLFACKGKTTGNATTIIVQTAQATNCLPREISDSLVRETKEQVQHETWAADRKFYEVIRRYDTTFTIYPHVVHLLDNRYLYLNVCSYIQEPIVHRLQAVEETDNEIRFICDTLAYRLFEDELYQLKESGSSPLGFYQAPDTLYFRRIDSGLWCLDDTELVEASDLPRPRFRMIDELYKSGLFLPMQQLPRLFYYVDVRYDGYYVDTNFQLRLLPHMAIRGTESGVTVRGYETDTEGKVIRGIPETRPGQTDNESYDPFLLLTDKSRYIWKCLNEMDVHWVDSADMERAGLANLPLK